MHKTRQRCIFAMSRQNPETPLSNMHAPFHYQRLLTIAGSDSGGGAGIQADLKTFSALGCYGLSVITAVTAQNTLGVKGIHPVPAAMVAAQLQAVLEDIGADAIKLGMLPGAAIVQLAAEAIQRWQLKAVLDPVMVSSSGTVLVDPETKEIMKTALFPIITLLTPNLDEAAAFTGITIESTTAMQKAAERLLQQGCRAVLLKGGHGKGEKIFDVLATRHDGIQVFEAERIVSTNLHGTGCTLSAAIAAYLAQAYPLQAAVVAAREFVQRAIEAGRDVQTGTGIGPLNHFFAPLPLKKRNGQ